MKSKKFVSLLLTGAMTTALLAVPAQAAEAPQSYTISASQWSREDFSQEANPEVFTGVYDRALYNTIRQTMVDGTSDAAPAYTMVAKGDEYSAVRNLIGRMEGVLRYEHHVPQNFTNYWQYLDYFAVSAEMPENYQEPFDFIQPTIQATDGMTDREKVEYFNDYIRSLLAYQKGKVSGITQTFAPHTGELKAACGSYARAMKFLCAAADIPCFTISSKAHTSCMWTGHGSMWMCPPTTSPAGTGACSSRPTRPGRIRPRRPPPSSRNYLYPDRPSKSSLRSGGGLQQCRPPPLFLFSTGFMRCTCSITANIFYKETV